MTLKNYVKHLIRKTLSLKISALEIKIKINGSDSG